MIDRLMEGGFQLLDCDAVKHGDVLDAGQSADKDAVLRIVLDAGGIAAVGHGAHGVIPAFSRNSHAATIPQANGRAHRLITFAMAARYP
jgi:hypothetical protein